MVTGFYSPISAKILFEGAAELLGVGRLKHLAAEVCLPSPSPLEAWAFLQSLETMYGVLGGRGLAFRIGRTAFKYALRHIDQEGGLRSREFHLLPQERRLETGLRVLAQEIGADWGQKIRVSSSPTSWFWCVEDCPVCVDRRSSHPCCDVLAGLLHAYMTWASGGRYFRTVETECRAVGKPACVFQIDMKPLD